MSTRKRRLKEYLKSAWFSIESASNKLNRAGYKGLALEAEILAKKIDRLLRTMTEPFDTEKVDLDTKGDEV